MAGRKKEKSTGLKTRHYESGRPAAGGSLLQAKISCRTLPRDFCRRLAPLFCGWSRGATGVEVVEVEQGVEDEEITAHGFAAPHGIVGE